MRALQSPAPSSGAPRRPLRRVGTAAGCLALAALGMAACGSSSSSASSGTAAQASGQDAAAVGTIPSTVPPGTTLHVADQLDYLTELMQASGENTGFPYKVDYSEFVGGPPMLQAFQAGAEDIGYVADTPLIFAQAAHQDVVGIAAWAPAQSSLALVSAPGQHISGWAALKGKKVAYQQGTVFEAALLEGLAQAGLSLKDITPVNVPITSITPALESGSVSAGILEQPLTAAYLAKEPTAAQVTIANGITDRADFIIADTSSLHSSAKEAAIADYLRRFQKALQWVNSHPTQWAQTLYVDQYKLPLAEGTRLIAAAGTVSFLPLPGTLAGPQQSLADLYLSAGEIPSKLNVASEFDGRFDTTLGESS